MCIRDRAHGGLFCVWSITVLSRPSGAQRVLRGAHRCACSASCRRDAIPINAIDTYTTITTDSIVAQSTTSSCVLGVPLVAAVAHAMASQVGRRTCFSHTVPQAGRRPGLRPPSALCPPKHITLHSQPVEGAIPNRWRANPVIKRPYGPVEGRGVRFLCCRRVLSGQGRADRPISSALS